jgi:CHAT domain-containing protein
LGRTHAAINEPDEAMQYYRWALNEYHHASNPMEAARTTALIGQLYQSQGKVDQARKQYQAALSEFRKLDDHLNESAALYAIGNLELEQNNLDVAEDYLRQSLAVTEDIRRVSTSNDLTTALSATLQDRYESLIDCLMRRSTARPPSDYAVRAFEMSEVGRARALTEFFRATQPNVVSGVDPSLAQKENSLRKELRVKEDGKVALLATNYKRDDLTKLESQITALEAEYKQVIDTLRHRDPAYEQMTQPTTWDLRRIQDELIVDDDTMLLEFSLGTKQSYLWVVTRNDFSSYELPAGDRIVAATKTVYDLVKEPPRDNSSAFNNSVRELTDMLLGPVDGKLRKRIIIVGDGALNYLPFQLLTVKSENGVPLATNHEIVNTPSASILGYLEEEAAHRPRREVALAAFGDPMFASGFSRTKNSSGDLASNAGDEGRSLHAMRDIELNGDSVDPDALQPLFFAKRELTMLREIAGDKSLVATGFDANADRLKSADLTPYAILHFATHGILDPKRPENSGIFLSTIQPDGRPQNGYLSLQDIYSLRAPVDLVVLSACQTGLGQEVRGEGLIGLTRGFMYAGAASVVASLWKVDDESTAELMKRFYTNMLQKGIPPAEALRAAQNSIRSEPQWSSPYYWAAFTLQGEYRNPIRLERAESNPKQALAIMIGLAAMGMLLWLSYRRMRNGSRTYSSVNR